MLFLQGDDYDDIHEVINHSIEKLEKKYGVRYDK